MTTERVEAIQQLWTTGDYAQVGDRFRPVAERLVEELAPAGLRVLDAGTGTGNLAVAAARAGADVDAFDLTPALLDEARRRAADAGVTVRFREGDLLDMPYADGTFDVVASTFAAFLADDPARCAAELVRVCAPGGRVVTTAWTTGSIYVAMIDLVASRWPDLAPDGTGPSAWADADRLRGLVDGLPVTVEERELSLRFPSADAALAFYEETSGPVQGLRAALDARGVWPDARQRIVGRWSELARPVDDGVELPATYALATVHRAAG